MIIDCHGHYTITPASIVSWRDDQLAAFAAGRPASRPDPVISDDEIRESLEPNQLRLLDERGTDLVLFSPRASTMGHHLGD